MDIATKQSHATKLFEQAASLQNNGKLEQAIAMYESVIKCNNELVDAYYNSGLAYQRLGKLEMGIRSLIKAVQYRPDFPEAHFHLGVWLSQIGNVEKAEQHFKEAARLNPQNGLAFTNLGVVLHQQGKISEALRSYEQGLRLNPTAAENYFNMGKAYQEIGDDASVHAAIKAFRTAVKVRPTYFEAYATLGGALTPLRKWKESAKILKHALTLNPNSAEGVYLLAHALMHLCAWDELNAAYDQLRHLVHQRLSSQQRPGVEPYAALTFPWNNQDLYDIAKFHADEAMEQAKGMRLGMPPWVYSFTLTATKKKLRVGLKSYDIGDHQSSYLICSTLELLAKSDRILLHIYGLRPDDGSALRRVIIAAAGKRWRDMSTTATPNVAVEINKDKIQILIDIDAHFRNSRLQVMAMRAAPVQIDYPMFVGTSGATFLTEIITDKISTTPEMAPYFSEHFVYIPKTFYTNSHAVMGASKGSSIRLNSPPPKRMDSSFRVQNGLPALKKKKSEEEDDDNDEDNDNDVDDDRFGGPILCNFNQFYKIDDKIYRSWMNILKAVPGSVLWLRSDSKDAQLTLKREAINRDIAADRIIFAKWAETTEEHLLRSSLSDLSLDTPLYNSMTTACDVLWAGVPLITVPGEKMVSRLASSLLHALGVDELITRNLEEFEAMALSLLTGPAHKLQRIRNKVEANRTKTSLFDMKERTKHLETALLLIWEAFLSNKSDDNNDDAWKRHVIIKE